MADVRLVISFSIAKGCMMLVRKLLLSLALTGFICGPALALEIGDKAPPLKVKKWIKGDKVDLSDLKDKEIVVVEFWATWCAPCRQSIPHLTELQEKYKDNGVRVIGVSTEAVSTVMDFVEGQGKKMEYTVVVDNDGQTANSLMQPFGVQGIPHAFVIDRKGKLFWHGHPMDKEFEEILEELVKDQPAPVDRKLKEARAVRKEYYKLAKTEDAPKDKLDELASQMLDLGGHDTEFLKGVVAMIVKSKKIKHRDLDLALRAAEKASELKKGKDCELNELCAHVYYKMGDMDNTLKYLRKALSVCENFDHEDQLEKRIARLKEKQSQS